MAERDMLAWAAGFFEGEGSIGGSTSAPGRPYLTVTNTDLERLELFREVVEFGKIHLKRHHPSRLGKKPVYQWQVYGDNAFAVYRNLEPWLGERRRTAWAQLERVRTQRRAEATKHRRCEGCGVVFQPKFSSGAKQQKYCDARCWARADYERRKMRAAQKRAA